LLSRRTFLAAGTALAFAKPALAKFEVDLSDEDWRDILTPEQYRVLRHSGTERPYSSPLNDETRAGVFHCAGCDLALYPSAAKFDSGTGWPSFWDSLPGAVGTKTEYKLIFARTEVHCRRCGGHLGHIFEDGPKPTGLRHCLNGVALEFKPDWPYGRVQL